MSFQSTSKRTALSGYQGRSHKLASDDGDPGAAIVTSADRVRYDRFMRLPEVLHITSLSRSTLYEKIARGMFPKQVRLGENIVAWHESDVIAWMRDPS